MSTVEPIRSILNIRQIEDILRKQSRRNLLLFVFGINCGLRISDILALNVKDVYHKSFIKITEKKTGKCKIIPLNKKLKDMLEEYVKDKSPEEPLFSSIYHNRLDRTMAYRIIKVACNIILPESNIGTHTLRKTFGYHHYKKFKDVAMLQKIFNHSDPRITMSYIGISQEEIFKSYMLLEL